MYVHTHIYIYIYIYVTPAKDHAVRGLGAGIALLPHERDPSEASVAVPIGSVRLGG